MRGVTKAALSLMALGIMAGASLPASAANGTLSYTYGNKPANYTTGGKMTSTADETSMEVHVQVQQNETDTDYRYTSGKKVATKTAERYVYEKNYSGRARCTFDLNGNAVYGPTVWFNFSYK